MKLSEYAGMCRHCVFKRVHLWGPPLTHCEVYAEMVQSPDVESPNPNPPPSVPTDESQPLTQQGWHLIEFPWFQWAQTQDLQVPVFAFDKQMTPMELRSQPAKTRIGKRKNKVPHRHKANIGSRGIESNDVYPVSVGPPLSPENSSTPLTMSPLLSPRGFFPSSLCGCSSRTRIRCVCI